MTRVLFAVLSYKRYQLLPPRVTQVQNLKQSIQIVHGLSAGLVVRTAENSTARRSSVAGQNAITPSSRLSEAVTAPLHCGWPSHKMDHFSGHKHPSICDATGQLMGPKQCIDNSGGNFIVIFKKSLCFIYRRSEQEPVVSQSKSLILMRFK